MRRRVLSPTEAVIYAELEAENNRGRYLVRRAAEARRREKNATRQRLATPAGNNPGGAKRAHGGKVSPGLDLGVVVMVALGFLLSIVGVTGLGLVAIAWVWKFVSGGN